MGRGRKGSGVDIKDGRLRVRFTWQGARVAELLDVKPTAGNLRFAERLVSEIREKIRQGTFVYDAYFPDSPRAKLPGAATPARDITFREYAARWLATLAPPKWAPSTKAGYSKYLAAFWYPAIGDKPLRVIKHIDLLEALAGKEWGSAKTRNNYLTPMREVFALARKDREIPDNPAEGIENAEVEDPEPDPLDPAEVDLVLDWMRQRYDEQVVNYCEFAFFTGLRTSELIALQWGDIDWTQQTVQVRRALVVKQLKRPKTRQGKRTVELLGRALKALQRQKAHTILRGPDAYVFNNPTTGRPWPDDKRQRQTYWQPSLARVGLRQRDAYQTRHTYATMMIMANANPTWLAKQMGHKDPKTLFKHYAEWLGRADLGREKARAEANLVRNWSVFTPRSSKCTEKQCFFGGGGVRLFDVHVGPRLSKERRDASRLGRCSRPTSSIEARLHPT
jgi:integrase